MNELIHFEWKFKKNTVLIEIRYSMAAVGDKRSGVELKHKWNGRRRYKMTEGGGTNNNCLNRKMTNRPINEYDNNENGSERRARARYT